MICLPILNENISDLITFNYINTKAKPTGVRKIKAFIPQIFKREKVLFESLNYVFCDDEYLLDINKRFLNHDSYTDIITFCLSPKDKSVVGEIYVSTDRVLENCRAYNVTYQDELLRVIFHGALHLCGYNDKKKAETQLMRKMEDDFIKQYKSLISRGTVR